MDSSTIQQAIQTALEHHQAGRLPQAEAIYRQILQVDPNHPDALHFLGAIALHEGKNAAAAELISKAISINPSRSMYYNLGNALQAQGKLEEAAESYRSALALRPDYAEAHINLGNVLQAQGRLDDAVEHYRKGLSFKPNFAEAHYNLGTVLQAQNKLAAAIDSFRKALSLKPDYAEAHYNLGNALQAQGKLVEAVESYRRAIALRPDNALAHNNMGNIFIALKQYPEAEASYLRVLEIEPDLPYVLGMHLHCKMQCCNWEGIDNDIYELLRGIDASKAVSIPFPVLAIPSTPAQQKHCTEMYVQKNHAEVPASSSANIRYSHDKIRIGYFSGDFHNHPGAYLMAGMLEEQDKSKFELIAFSFGPNKNDEMQKRITAAFDNFIDVRNLSDEEVAMLARRLEIDIAIDRKGFTLGSRTGIFAFRPAPVQVGYLAYPATMGAPYIDYIIADPTLIPIEYQQHYTEKIVYMPDSYQANDSRRRISERQFTRSEAGLPDEGFVFCCFNNNFKITPAIFDIWMQILKQVEGSVLWMLEGNTYAGQNLQKEAKKRGVAPERIVFAGRMGLSDHLARHRLADLFLDTFYYNAHTTASDALWAGLPVLTYLGDTFAGRVAASLLNAIGLPELITHTHEEYKALALGLATHPEKLVSIKQKLARNRATHPLFNTVLYTRYIEDAFTQMWKRHQESLPPDHIYVRANK